MQRKELKYIGRDKDIKKKYWMLDPDSMIKRAFESIFGNGNTHRRIDKKRIPLVHLEILRRCGYIKDLPNLGICILTDKAFSDKDEILCTKD